MQELDIFKFRDYDPLAETKDGEYWKFTTASVEEVSRVYEICMTKICGVISQVSNDELKSKMKDKLVEYIKTKGISSGYAREIYVSKLFNNDEIYSIISEYLKDFKVDVDKKIHDNKEIIPRDISYFLGLYIYLDDEEFKKKDISELLEIIRPLDNFQKILIEVLNDFERKDEEIYFYFLDKYYNLLPEPYQKYLHIINNPDGDYLCEKSKKFQDMGVNIGIDPNISIGVEIESNNSCYINWVDFEEILLGQNKFKSLYTVDSDATVPDGVEVKSNPFYDNVVDVSNFCAVCEFMGELGYYYDEKQGNAGGQINLGLDYLDSSRSILNFYELFGNCEELLFYISNESGQLIRQPINQNSRFKPISEVIGARIVDEDISRESVIEMFNSSPASDNIAINGLYYKKNTVCLRGHNEENYRLEFRIPNGGVNYKTWIDNIRLYGKMMEVSKKMADALNKDYLSSQEEKMINIHIELQNKNLELSDKLILLMDLLFEDDKIKLVYYDRFKSTVKKIQETGTTNYNVRRHETGFDSVNFQSSYVSKLGSNGNISYDPETGIYIEDDIRRHI